MCDGDIDPEWIESLNSVLDDNRLLTMPSGERIQFGPNVNFLFETHDLSCASPATISRMGMIFLRSVSLCRQGFTFFFVPNSIFLDFLSHGFFFFIPTIFQTYIFSDEDIDVGALMKSWLRSQPEECRSKLENWLGDYFQRALDWVVKQVTFALSFFYTLVQKQCYTLGTKGFGLDAKTALA